MKHFPTVLTTLLLATTLAAAGCNSDHSNSTNTNSVNSETKNSEATLLQAAYKGDINTVKSLISSGINVNVKDDNGQTPLHKAVIKNHIDVVKALISSEADVNAKSNIGKNALHFSLLLLAEPEVVKTLISSGVDVNSKDNNGDTPLHIAASAMGLEMMLKFASNTTEKDIRDTTEKYTNAIKLLIDAGADVNAKNNKGETPFDVAKAKERQSLANVLRTYSAANNVGAQAYAPAPAAAQVAPDGNPDAQDKSSPIQFHGTIPAADAEQLKTLLKSWNDAMNNHDASAVANLHTQNAIIRGKAYSIAEYRDKEAKAFAKHPDFAQTLANDVYVTPLQDQKGYHLIFDETFTQGGKSTPTEIMLVVVRQGADYKISYESDISTDRSLNNKMGVKTWTTSSDCIQLIGQIMFESPMFRYEYIPDNQDYAKSKSLSIACEDEECNVYNNGIILKSYELDLKALKLTAVDFDYTNEIHPKYSSQIRRLCTH